MMKKSIIEVIIELATIIKHQLQKKKIDFVTGKVSCYCIVAHLMLGRSPLYLSRAES